MVVKDKKEFNYCVGHYWPGGSLNIYAYGSEHFHGTMKEAKAFRKYVEKQDPIHDWKIFHIVEIPE